MIRQILLALLANLTSLGVSSLTLFLIPRWLSVSQYNYFQLYLFYAAYLPYLHLGLADGIYLRYGGYSFAQLDHRRLAGQFWFLGGLCLTLSLGLVILTHDLLFQYLALALLLTVPKIWISYLLQTTGKIDAYTRLTLTEKLCYAFSVLLLGLGGGLNVTRLIGLDLISRLAGLLYAGYLARTILFSRPPSWSVLRIELKENWLDGSKLMLATISGALMIGLVRWGIEKEWDLYTFGQVSLGLSMANLLTVLIQAMSMVLFPVLKRLSPEKLAAWYPLLRNALMFALVFLLVIYYPLEQFIAFWLPQYQDSLVYLALLFSLMPFRKQDVPSDQHLSQSLTTGKSDPESESLFAGFQFLAWSLCDADRAPSHPGSTQYCHRLRFSQSLLRIPAAKKHSLCLLEGLDLRTGSRQLVYPIQPDFEWVICLKPLFMCPDHLSAM